MGFFDYLASYLPDPEIDEYSYNPITGGGYLPSALKRGVGEVFGVGKRGVDWLHSRLAGLEETVPVEELAVSAIAPEILPGDPQLPPAYQNLYNLGRGVTRVGARFGLDPLMPIMNVPGKAGAALGGYFGLEGAIGAKEQAQKALEAPSLTEAIEPGVEALGSAAMAGMGFGALGKHIRGSRSPRVAPETIEGSFEVKPSDILTDETLMDAAGAKRKFEFIDEATPKTHDELMTPEEWQKQERNDNLAFDEELLSQSVDAPKPREHVLEDLVVGPKEVFNRRFENMTNEYLNRIRDRAAELLQDPGIKETQIRVGELKTPGGARFDEKTNTIWMDPETLAKSTPDQIADVLTHELAHRYSLHEFPGVAPEKPWKQVTGDGKLIEEEFADGKRGYTPIGEGKFAEVDPFLAEHTEANIPERAKFSSSEHAFQTAIESLQNDPSIRSIRDRYAQNLKRPLAEEFRRERGLPTFEEEGEIPPALAAPEKPKGTGISESADNFRKLLQELKITRFNKNTIDKTLQEVGVPEEIRQNVPELLEELKNRGWVNEKIAGTMTLQIEPPKRVQELKPKQPEEVTVDLEDALTDSIEFIGEKQKPIPVKTQEPAAPKTPQKTLAQQMQEKLTPEELAAINEVLGGEKLPKLPETGTKQIPEEVRLAQEAAKKGQPPTPGKRVSAEERRTKKNWKVTLSDGTEHIIKAPDADAAKVRAQQVLGKYKSTKTVDKVEPSLSSLEKAAKYEVEPQKEGFEILGEETGAKKKTQSLEEKAVEAELKSQLKVEADYKKAQEKIKQKEARELEKRKKVEELEKGFSGDVTDIPKTLKASFDISWPGRQGLFLLNRKAARKGMSQGLLSGLPFKGEEFHAKTKANLLARPNAELYQKSGLNQFKYDPTQDSRIAGRSEEFPARAFAEKIPGVKQSERMFLDMGNLARANMFDEFAAKFQKQGKTFETHPELYKGLAEYLNVLTLRKPLPEKLQQAGWILNKMFFSPMAVYSRFQQVNPNWYRKLPPEMRKAALRDVGGTLAAITGLLGLTSYAASQAGIEDVDFETDPANTHFGRLKVGKTYYDLHGLTPMLRTFYRMVSGRKSTSKGEYALPGGLGYDYQDLPDAPFGQSAFGEMTRFVENKTAPIYQASKGLFTGKDWYGKDYNFQKMLVDLFVPMSIESIGEAGKQYGTVEALKQTPELIGFSTYTEFPDEKTSGKKKGSKKKQLTQPLY